MNLSLARVEVISRGVLQYYYLSCVTHACDMSDVFEQCCFCSVVQDPTPAPQHSKSLVAELPQLPQHHDVTNAAGTAACCLAEVANVCAPQHGAAILKSVGGQCELLVHPSRPDMFETRQFELFKCAGVSSVC